MHISHSLFLIIYQELYKRLSAIKNKKYFFPGYIVKEDLSHVILIKFVEVQTGSWPAEDSSVDALWAPRCGRYVEDLGNNIFVLMCHRAALMGMNRAIIAD